MNQLLFDIVEHMERDQFMREVQRRLDDNWQLHGSMQVVVLTDVGGGERLLYVQALVKDNRNRGSGLGFKSYS